MDEAHQCHTRLAVASHNPHGFCCYGEGGGYNVIKTSWLGDQYILTCCAEGKTFSFIRCCGGNSGGIPRVSRGFLVREGRLPGRLCHRDGKGLRLPSLGRYSSSSRCTPLQSPPEYGGHPTNPAQHRLLAQAAVKNHVRALRSFSSWLDG